MCESTYILAASFSYRIQCAATDKQAEDVLKILNGGK
jgi:hypothetical protein